MIPGQIDLLQHLPLEGVDWIVDLGPGVGEASVWFRERGLKVVGYGIDPKSFKAVNVPFVCGNIDELLCTYDGEAPAIWCAHVLEHVLDVEVALQTIHAALKKDGWLFLSVPPFKTEVVGGHVCTGWTIGQLMYVLILTGFDVRNGHFVKHGYNLAAFVRKSERLPHGLIHDCGDIESLVEQGFWPNDPMFKHGFNGDMIKWNWPPRQGV